MERRKKRPRVHSEEGMTPEKKKRAAKLLKQYLKRRLNAVVREAAREHGTTPELILEQARKVLSGATEH